MLCTTDTFYEGVDFDLTYFPLKHLGYKIVTAGVSDILAMNATPSQLLLSVGVSSKLPVEASRRPLRGRSATPAASCTSTWWGATRAPR